MVYLEHSSTKFWRCEKQSTKKVIVRYGKCGFPGRTIVKHFSKPDDAKSYIAKQVASKLQDGYVDAEDPNQTDQANQTSIPEKLGTKRKCDTAIPPSTKSKRVGLAKHCPPDVDDFTIQLDSGLARVDSALASRSQVHDEFHAKLSLVDPSQNSDKYYILQIVFDDSKKKAKRSKIASKAKSHTHYVYTRWGRTGTGGQAKLDGPFPDADDAVTKFKAIFKAKTGTKWENATPGSRPEKGFYEFMKKKKKVQRPGRWCYHLTNDPLGKPDGWYNYDENNNDEVEELFVEYISSNCSERLSTRFIHSENSGFTYKVDLIAYTQTNTTSLTQRSIFRSIDGIIPSTVAPKIPPTPVTVTSSKTPSQVLSTPVTVTPSSIASSILPTPVISTPSAKKSIIMRPVDPDVSSSLKTGSVHSDYDIMLNQTNLRDNNNKFYKIQLIQKGGNFYVFTKWGRVGESGKTQESKGMALTTAIKEFEKKFKSKSGNAWDDRDNFESVTGKYSIVEMEMEENEVITKTSGKNISPSPVPTLPSALDSTTKSLLDLIFDEDMFKSAMSELNIDTQKLPLGALSKSQIAKGFGVLENLENEVKKSRPNSNRLMELTSEFYTTIPHAFGRRRGPVLSTLELVQEKYEMLNTLTDIETAQSMQTNIKVKEEDDQKKQKKHPSDCHYEQLLTDLSLLEKNGKEYEIIETYLRQTSSKSMNLSNVWKVNRHNESTRFAQHGDLSNRRLLWHGTSVAVVAAILKSGLRIMPHSGGRVGRGIYLADQHQKSAQYVRPAKKTCIMFLVEAALGKQHEILRDDGSLVCAPDGYHSVLARGRLAPKEDVTICDFELDGNKVHVPQGAPVKIPAATNSSFYHNEFLIYKESQHRIRYILTFDTV